jgi:FixJ family two-component response regulator
MRRSVAAPSDGQRSAPSSPSPSSTKWLPFEHRSINTRASSDLNESDSIAAGAVDFLTKPVSSHELFPAIERAIAHHEAARELKSKQDIGRAHLAALTPHERQVFELIVLRRFRRAVCVLLDIDLGDGSGIELRYHLKAANIDVPVTYMTGNEDPVS